MNWTMALSWAAPMAVALVNLVLTGRLLRLKEEILKQVREEFEPRESCALRHVAMEQLIRLAGERHAS